MKTTVTLFAFSLFTTLLLITSCQKSLSDQNVKYIGSWGSDKYSIEIWKDGRGVYERKNQSTYDGRVVIANNQIKFRGSIMKTFNIDQDPYVDANGNKVMILNGNVFYKH